MTIITVNLYGQITIDEEVLKHLGVIRADWVDLHAEASLGI